MLEVERVRFGVPTWPGACGGERIERMVILKSGSLAARANRALHTETHATHITQTPIYYRLQLAFSPPLPAHPTHQQHKSTATSTEATT